MSSPSAHPVDALLSLLYGELSEAEARRVQAHLDGCPECTAALHGYRAVRTASAALPREVQSAKGLDSLLHYAAQAQARARRRRVALWAGSLLSGAAAAAMLLLLLQPEAPRVPVASSAPPAVGPLASNDVAAAPEDKTELAQELAPLRGAAAGAPARNASTKAAAPPAVADAARARVPAAPAAKRAEPADSAQGMAQAAAPGALRGPRAERLAVGEASGGVSAGKATASQALAAPSSAPAAMEAHAAPAFAARAVGRPDGGSATGRPEDEARREVLLQKLATASLAEALPLRAELCTLEVRLRHRADAARVCTAVVAEYPGTAEAEAAAAELEVLKTQP